MGKLEEKLEEISSVALLSPAYNLILAHKDEKDTKEAETEQCQAQTQNC
jgi:hypothetical protein